jgi:acetyl-CoA C-acetyltransferase
LWEEVCRAAATDTGAPPERVLQRAGSLTVLYCQSWQYDDPPGRLASRLGISPADCAYSGIGGTTPHRLVSSAADAIRAGDLDVALIVGGEALETARQAKKAGERLEWSHRDPEKKPFPFEEPFHPAEVAHEVFPAWLTFAVFDIARRHHLGTEPSVYRRSLGELLAPMSAVAESNPHAWFRRQRSVDELIEPTASNRMVGYPYTKLMTSIMDVDMAAALIIASDEAAGALGVPSERRIYLRGSAEATDPVYIAEHDPMWASPAMSRASVAALGQAGVSIDDVGHLDLYSCFASSLDFACDALGLRPGDGRSLTVTGGLPFAGGPGSGYLLHSTAAMADVLRADPGSVGLVSGVGMHMTKHAFGVYSSEPPTETGPSAAVAPAAGAVAGVTPARSIVEVWDGEAEVAAYTVVHDRSGPPAWGLAVCEVEGGARVYARVEDESLLEWIEKEEWVGQSVHLAAGEDRVNRVVGS